MLDSISMLEMPFAIPCSREGAIPSVWGCALPDKGGKVPYWRSNALPRRVNAMQAQ